MRPRASTAAARAVFLWAACVLGAVSRGADSGQGPWPELALKGGRVLHNAKVLSDEGDNVVVRCDEGLVKVAKSSLPQAASAAYPARPEAAAPQEMVMAPFDPDRAPLEVEPEAKAKAKPAAAAAKAPPPAAGVTSVFKGCSITSFTMKTFHNSLGCVEVVVQNASDARALILPGDFACITSDGKRLDGRQIVEDGFPQVVKRRQFVPALGSADFVVTFANEALDVSDVRWAR
jgi:hypothetical protein